ncbi:MAG: extradiol ring-cleavage dioxygenase [Betaproteobacteria bacterium]|nr:extradiol ring-cleavage dioxygenase [Betaproteobacteria bacterium]MDH3437956.1 extradiol ring-cleavage dioxygenase [Betaproteobacteria bacterium]
MGQILGLGMTHYPNLSVKGNMSRRMRMSLDDPLLAEKFRSPDNWHPTMREQWGNDQGQAHSDRHRQDLVGHFRTIRAELDAFKPDFVVIWGDDQYENFREDCVPPYSVLAYDSFEFQPWKNNHRGKNVWDESDDKTFTVKGHRAAGKYLATALLKDGIDVAYAYKPLHDGLGHAFTNSVLYLDYDRKGFPYPIVPFAVNAYGRWLIHAQGSPMRPSEAAEKIPSKEADLDPPSPQPWRCFQVGAAIARALQKSPWRVAVVASSSWSHSFLVQKHSLMFPDVEADKRYYEALSKGDWEVWRNTTIEEVEDRGHHELLNWFCLAGAMHELGRKPDESVFLESWITNSDKVFAIFRPNHAS